MRRDVLLSCRLTCALWPGVCAAAHAFVVVVVAAADLAWDTPLRHRLLHCVLVVVVDVVVDQYEYQIKHQSLSCRPAIKERL